MVATLEESLARRQIVAAGRAMRARQLVVAREGNLSARVGVDLFLTTPAGADKGELAERDLVLVDGRGEPVAGGRPSSETPMHLAIYEVRSDVAGITHGHPPHATAFALAGRALDRCLLPEVVVDLGRVPLSEYGTPSTEEIPTAVRSVARDHHAFLLRNHGAVSMGPDVRSALDRLETVEQLARITLFAEMLGGAQGLDEAQVRALMDIRGGYGLSGSVSACATAPRAGESRTPESERLRALVERTQREVLG